MAKLVHNETITEVLVIQQENYTLTLTPDEASMLRTILGNVASGTATTDPIWEVLYRGNVPVKRVRYFDGFGGTELTAGIQYVFTDKNEDEVF
jgi:hypothetical protein